MGSYGRHFDFRQPPLPQDRLGRYFASAATLIGAPVEVVEGEDQDANGRLPLTLATGATEPVKTKHGVLVYEFPTPNKDGFDPVVTSFSDLDTCPAGEPCQLVSGAYVRVAYWNYDEVNFQDQREYAARTMVAGVAIPTPTVTRGEYLTPGVGNDTDGYWAVTADRDEAWLVVTGVDNSTGLTEAQFLF